MAILVSEDSNRIDMHIYFLLKGNILALIHLSVAVE